ncbi:MAG: hypothetical protein M1814_006289 [Vezdaea aestivalis]|nr:MAG: hypothetical protein M1814_006289 [Vezdaea aestivalis]
MKGSSESRDCAIDVAFIEKQITQSFKDTKEPPTFDTPSDGKQLEDLSPALTGAATMQTSSLPATPAGSKESGGPQVADTDFEAGRKSAGDVKGENEVGDTKLAPDLFSGGPKNGSLQPVSAENAQALLPPSACVFVANLTQARTDEELERSVTEAFGCFGRVYVKIRRDPRGMPFAFCQYEVDTHAGRAISEGRRTLIDGRPCRTEPARANRMKLVLPIGSPTDANVQLGSIYMSKLNGGPVSIKEALEELQQFGSIENSWYPSQTDREIYRLPEGIWLKFGFYQACRDAQVAFRDHPIYRLEQSDHRFRSNAGSFAPPTRGRPYRQVRPQRGPPSALEGKAIYVGNLPPSITEVDVAAIFGAYGNIVGDIHISRRTSPAGAPMPTFAFISFYNESSANNAISNENGSVIQGYTIKVQLKASYGRPFPDANQPRGLRNNNWRQSSRQYPLELSGDTMRVSPINQALMNAELASSSLVVPKYDTSSSYHNGPSPSQSLGTLHWQGMDLRQVIPWHRQPQFQGPQNFDTHVPGQNFFPVPSGIQYNPGYYPIGQPASQEQYAWPGVYRQPNAGQSGFDQSSQGDH